MPEPLMKLVDEARYDAALIERHCTHLNAELCEACEWHAKGLRQEADRLEAALKACPSAREWLIGGGGGHEDGADGLRALTVSGEGLVEFLEAYRRDILGVRDE